MSDQIRAAREAHHMVIKTLADLGDGRSVRTTSTLAELRYGDYVTRALKSLGDHLDAIAKSHGDADDAAQSARSSVQQARCGC